MVAATAGKVQRPRVEGFEGLRAVAALAVFAFHLLHMTYAPKSHWVVRELSGDLNSGVVVFFVISGFLLYLPFARANGSAGPGVDVRGFFVRRAARIYPGYWLALLGALAFLIPVARFESVGEGLQHALLVHSYTTQWSILAGNGIGQSWTLVVEISFYVFLPLYAAVIRGAARRVAAPRVEWIGVATLAAIGLAVQAAVQWGDVPRWGRVLPAHLFYFALGIGLAVARAGAERGSRANSAWQRFAEPVGRWWSAALVVYLVAAPMPGPLWPPVHAWSSFLVFVLQGVVAFALVAPFTVVLPRPHRIRSLVSGRVLVFLGAVSYGIYLWHPAMMHYVEDAIGRDAEGTLLKLTALAVPLTVLVAWLSYRFVEAPVIRWAHGVTGRRGDGGRRERTVLGKAPDGG